MGWDRGAASDWSKPWVGRTYRNGRGVFRVEEELCVVGDGSTDYGQWEPRKCACGREIHLSATGQRCLRCWVRERRS